MLERLFAEVYTKFKIHFYTRVFSQFENREANLTTVETFCIEIIHALNKPTVNEFATFVQISAPNAAYKVNSLVQKGYLRKKRSDQDRREYHLLVTDKYFRYYNLSTGYIHTVIKRMRQRLSPEEIQCLERVLAIISEELMPEIDLPKGLPPLPEDTGSHDKP
jgi:DNA-binding MarR family transcriptional regulator